MLSEGVTNFHNVANHSRRTKPGTLMTSGGGSLGWNGGAAVGVKLARPDAFVTTMTGDGTYMFSIPSTVHWMARRYRTPFLQVIFNNKRLARAALFSDRRASGGAREPGRRHRRELRAAAGLRAASPRRRAARMRREFSESRKWFPRIERAMRAVREEKRCAVIDASI